MHRWLKAHADDPPLNLEIEVIVERTGASLLSLRYLMAWNGPRLRIPRPAASERTDGLWAHSCFEAFVRLPGEEGYWEFNFSPSSQWAAYRFDAYRSGMRNAHLPQPRIDVPENWDALDVRADLDGLPAQRPWQIGLAAVVEEKSGRKSHWALSHPPGTPDFHHPDCFVLDLTAAG